MLSVRLLAHKDREWMMKVLLENWASTIIVTRGISYEAENLPGFVAEIDGKRFGLLTYNIKNEEIEIVTMNAIEERKGIGTALLDEIESFANQKNCKRLWLITTNDNVDALRFYQKRGYEIRAVHRNSIEESRKIKPQIPLIGNYGIPIRDEIEMEKLL